MHKAASPLYHHTILLNSAVLSNIFLVHIANHIIMLCCVINKNIQQFQVHSKGKISATENLTASGAAGMVMIYCLAFSVLSSWRVLR